MSVTVFSIYIPRIKSVYCGEKYVSSVFDEAGVGTVSRVDFTSIQKCAGFKEEYSDEGLSAFVHFKQLYKNPLVGRILKYIQDEIPFRFFPHKTSAFGNGSKNEGGMYWMLLPNLFPVPETRMNTSQIVENCRFLEKTVADQAERIVLLENNLANCVMVVYQMTGGMWCQKTQGSTIDRHHKGLFGEMDRFNPETEEDQDTSKWGIWPTTRQGDANETRIEELERKIAELTAPKVYPAYEAWRNEPNLAFDLDDDLRSIGSPLSVSELRLEDEEQEEQKEEEQKEEEQKEEEQKEEEQDDYSDYSCPCDHEDWGNCIKHMRQNSINYRMMWESDEMMSDYDERNQAQDEKPDVEQDDNNSEDTPSSLPGLIDIVSDGSEQSDGSRTSKRVVNSYDLCGNE